MPFTPLHIGPGLALKALAGRWCGPLGAMILSEHKGVLSVCAWISGGGTALAFALFVRLLFGGPVSPWLEHTTLSLYMLALLAFLVAMLLMTEHTRAKRSGEGLQSARGNGLIVDAARYCPGPLKGAALAGTAFASLQMLKIEEVSVVAGPVTTVRDLRGFLSGAVVFLCPSFPVIASAALMEGGYGD